MLTRCSRRLSKAASPSLRDASCVAQKQHPSPALFLVQRRALTGQKHSESFTEQLSDEPSSSASDGFSFDASLAELFGDKPTPSAPAPRQPPAPRPRRQTLSKKEQDALADMLDMVIKPPPASSTSSYNSTSSTPSTSSTSSLNTGLFDSLRSVYKPRAQRSADDVLFDEKKEQIALCQDDMQLLEWTVTEVFAESERYDAAARAAIEANATLPPTAERMPIPPLQPPTYRRIIPHLMHVFRDQWRQPHLSVSIFRYAQRLSVSSFVYGCGTEAYNELLETQWMLRDLAAVRDVLQEMHRHAVPLSPKTDTLVDRIRRELTKQQLASATSDATSSTGEATKEAIVTDQMQILAEIEAEIARVDQTRRAAQEKFANKPSSSTTTSSSSSPSSQSSSSTSTSTSWGAWKRQELRDDEGGFDDWSNLDGRQEVRERFKARRAEERFGGRDGLDGRMGGRDGRRGDMGMRDRFGGGRDGRDERRGGGDMGRDMGLRRVMENQVSARRSAIDLKRRLPSTSGSLTGFGFGAGSADRYGERDRHGERSAQRYGDRDNNLDVGWEDDANWDRAPGWDSDVAMQPPSRQQQSRQRQPNRRERRAHLQSSRSADTDRQPADAHTPTARDGDRHAASSSNMEMEMEMESAMRDMDLNSALVVDLDARDFERLGAEAELGKSSSESSASSSSSSKMSPEEWVLSESSSFDSFDMASDSGVSAHEAQEQAMHYDTTKKDTPPAPAPAPRKLAEDDLLKEAKLLLS